jgi:hypothetical protein
MKKVISVGNVRHETMCLNYMGTQVQSYTYNLPKNKPL